ncbi:MAG: glycosyltransferase, partial [bacterium]|nr:glycosyltransferase [bacterium]
FIQYKKFIKLYSRLSFLLILSQYEGGPASLPEAIASYTPVITTKVGMCIDYIKHGVNGYFIDNSVNNIISLFANIEQDYFSQRNIFNSTYLYNQNNMPLTWKAVVQQYSDIFYSML